MGGRRCCYGDRIDARVTQHITQVLSDFRGTARTSDSLCALKGDVTYPSNIGLRIGAEVPYKIGTPVARPNYCNADGLFHLRLLVALANGSARRLSHYG